MKRIIFLAVLGVGLTVGVAETTTASASTIDNSAPQASILSGNTMQGSGGTSISAWKYQYTAGPFALFKNTVTGAWKHTQVVSTTSYTVTVIFDGVVRTFHL